MKIYKEIFVPYKIALGLKEKGFDMACIGSFTDKDTFNFTDGGLMYRVTPSDKKFCIAPLYQQVVDWFRERHNKVIEVSLYYKDDKNSWTYEISEYGKRKTYIAISKYNLNKTYYKALDKAIKEALKLI